MKFFRQPEPSPEKRYNPEQIFSDDFFLVTYPKSGTTWLAYLLANVMCLQNDMAIKVGLATIDGLIPNAPVVSRRQEKFAAGFPGYRVFKCHSPLNLDFRNVLYMVRDPRDVMVSYYKHAVSLGMFEGTISEFVRSESFGISTWMEHVDGWINRSAVDQTFLLKRYEDLLQTPIETLTHIYEFFGHSVSDAVIAEAVSLSAFSNMKRDEQQYGYGGRKRFSDYAFFRRGVAGDHQSELSTEDQAFIVDQSRNIMQALGYL